MSTYSGHRQVISFRSALILATFMLLGYLSLIVFFRNDQELRIIISDLLFPVFNALATVGLIYAARSTKIFGRRIHIAWTIMAVAQLSFTLGDIAWTVLEVGFHEEPFPSVADGLYLLCYPLFAAGIFLLPAKPLNRDELLKLLLDTGIVMSSTVLVFWAFLIEPLIVANKEDTLTLAITLAYPVMGLILFFGLLQLLFRRLNSAGQGPLLLLSAGIVAGIFTNVAYLLQSLQGTYESGNFLDMGWLINYAFIGLGGVLQANTRTFDPSKSTYQFEIRRGQFGWLTYLPYFFAAGGYLMLIWSRYHLGNSFSAFSWGVGSIIGLVILRQVVAFNENVRLYKTAQNEIDERKLAEQRLRRSEESYRTVFEVAPEVIFTLSSKDATITSLNPAFEKFTGWSAAEWLGKSFAEIMHPEDLPVALEMFSDTMRGEAALPHELRCLSKSGKYLTAEIMGVPQIENGTIIGKLGFARDITDRKLAEEALQKSERSYRLLAENVTDVIWTMDMDLKFTYLSPSIIRTIGYSVEEATQLTLDKLITSSSLSMIKQVFAEELEKEKDPQKDLSRSRIIEAEEYCKDGHTIWVEVKVSFLRDQEGRAVGMQGISREITDRKKAERELIESEAKYRTIFENTGNAAVILEEDTTISLANAEAEKFFGYIAANVVGKKSWTEFIVKDDLKIMKKYHDLRRSDPLSVPRNYEFRLIDGLGKIRHIFMTIAMIPGTKQSVASLLDITERKTAEEKLKASLVEKEMLLKEIHHRVKNNLQVVSSLLSLQSQSVTDKQTLDILQESQNRIKSMAMIHEKLYRSEDIAKINFSEYIRSLSANLIRSYDAVSGGVRLDLNVEDIDLGIDAAIPCGLIVNELVSNSLKYAFPVGFKSEDCKITIEFLRIDDNKFKLSVSDNGIGISKDKDFRQTESLGLQLVRILTDQLGGTIELSRRFGTEFKIIFSESERDR